MQETWVSFLGQEEPLEKGIATHSIIIAWEIPWTLEPGRLQSMGLQKSWACLVTTQQHLKKKKKDKTLHISTLPSPYCNSHFE